MMIDTLLAKLKDKTGGRESFKEKYKAFTRLLLKNLANDPKENTVFSPFSVMMLLTMMADSTAGNTRNEIEKALSPGEEFNNFSQQMQKIQKVLSKTSAFHSANAVWVRDIALHTVGDDYIRRLRGDFQGEIFSSAHMAEDVDRWVKEKTSGMIDHLADPSMQEALFCLLNAVAFDSEWEEPYEDYDIYEADFRNANGTSCRIPMLHSTEDIYVENGIFTGFVKPYKDNAFSFMALLPKNGLIHTPAVSAGKADFAALFSSGKEYIVSTAMPEFSASSRFDLKDLCTRAGIREIFTETADFSPMSPVELMADNICHKARIDVDRKGTKAAAVTWSDVAIGALPDRSRYKTVCLDHPFLYAVIHNQSGLPVFTGTVNRIQP